MDDVPNAFDAAHVTSAEIVGKGLVLRSWNPDDDDDVADWLRGVTDPEFRRWNTPRRRVRTTDEARAALRHRQRQRARGEVVPLCITEDNATLGHIGINAIDPVMRSASVGYVGYWVLPEARGRGVASRALIVVADWAFADLRLHRIELDHAVGHAASCRVAERSGFAWEGTLRGKLWESDRTDLFRDAHLHARLAGDPNPSGPVSPLDR